MSKYLAIAAFVLGSISAIAALLLYISVSTLEHRDTSRSSYGLQSEADTAIRYRSVADGSYQAPSQTATNDAYLLVEKVWWNSEQIPNLCYQIENVGMAASSHYALEVYRGDLEEADIMLRTVLRSPLGVGQNILACMAVPVSVRRERESILLVAKEIR